MIWHDVQGYHAGNSRRGWPQGAPTWRDSDGFAFWANIGLTIAQIYRIDILDKPLEIK